MPARFRRTRRAHLLIIAITALCPAVLFAAVGPAGPAMSAPAPKITVVPGGRPVPAQADGRVSSSGTTLPPGTALVRAVEVARAEQPVAAVQRADDPAIYIVEKAGRIKALRDGAVDPVPVLDIAAKVSVDNERGLLGLAFAPNRRDVLYIDYTDKAGRITVAELRFDGRTADVTTERVLLSLAKRFNEHNAGTLLFDSDGLLYVSIGDGGSSGDPSNNGQRIDTLFGKVLRIDPNPSEGIALPYSIPPSNPFARRSLTGRNGRPEIVAYGLRNPWGISLDATTKTLWIPDVGENSFEEINRMPLDRLGANFGWRAREGRARFKGPKPTGAVDPIYDYPHKDGRCAVVGGFVYRGPKLVALQGLYVFGDVCSGRIMGLRAREGDTRGWEALDLGAQIPYLTGFGIDSQGELLALSLNGGVYRLEP